GRLWRLLAGERGGAVARVHAAAGDPVTSEDWLATLTSADVRGARDSVNRQHQARGDSGTGSADVLAFAPTGGRLAVGRAHQVAIHDLGTGTERAVLNCQHQVRRVGFDASGHVWALTVSDTGAEVVTEQAPPQ